MSFIFILHPDIYTCMYCDIVLSQSHSHTPILHSVFLISLYINLYHIIISKNKTKKNFLSNFYPPWCDQCDWFLYNGKIILEYGLRHKCSFIAFKRGVAYLVIHSS